MTCSGKVDTAPLLLSTDTVQWRCDCPSAKLLLWPGMQDPAVLVKGRSLEAFCASRVAQTTSDHSPSCSTAHFKSVWHELSFAEELAARSRRDARALRLVNVQQMLPATYMDYVPPDFDALTRPR